MVTSGVTLGCECPAFITRYHARQLRASLLGEWSFMSKRPISVHSSPVSVYLHRRYVLAIRARTHGENKNFLKAINDGCLFCVYVFLSFKLYSLT